MPSTTGAGSGAASRHHSWLDAVNDATKWAVSAVAACALLARRDAHCAWCVVGAVLAAALCRALKHALNESRPAAARKADPGMPSSHANSLAFLATYVSLAALQQALPNGPPRGAVHAALVLGPPTLAAFLAWLRVALGYHTPAQVLAGAALGAGAAAVWSRFGAAVVFPLLAASPRREAWLFAATAAAVAAFAVQNVSRWGAQAEGVRHG